MPVPVLLILIGVGLILGRLVPAKILVALMVIVGVLFLIMVGAHYHVFQGT